MALIITPLHDGTSVGLFDAFKAIMGGKKAAKAPGKPGAKPASKAVAPAKPAKKFVPKKINLEKRFDMQARTGQGSMSKVWRAYDRSLGRSVCLKVLDKEKTAKFEARFVGKKKPSEGEICLQLQHKNIVKTFEWGLSQKGETFLVMELIDGNGMNFLIETKSPKLKGNEVAILAQLADALEYLHREKFLHRDLCPRNVMVTNDGIVKLIDFGLTIPYTPEFCTPGNRTGTPDYLAPEVIRRQSTDHRVDLFALGVTAFEVFTGGLPWERSQGSMEALLKHINSPARDPRDFMPTLDDATHAFLVKAVERDPKDRFQNATEFRQALRRLKAAPADDESESGSFDS